MIKEISEGYDIDKVYADKAHDNRRSFNLLDNLNIYRTCYSNKKERVY